jgi:hypothetical protein
MATVPAELRKPFPGSASPSWPPNSRPNPLVVERILAHLEGLYDHPERLRPALEALQREAPQGRKGYVVQGQWTLTAHLNGTVSFLGHELHVAFLPCSSVDVRLFDGELRVSDGRRVVVYEARREGVPIRLGPQRIGGGCLAVRRSRLTAAGELCVNRQTLKFGHEKGMRGVFVINLPNGTAVFTDLGGGLLRTIEEADYTRRRLERRSRRAETAARRLRGVDLEELAAAWLLKGWRDEPDFLGTRGRTIVVDGLIPWERLTERGIAHLDYFDAAGRLHRWLRLSSGDTGCILQVEGRWWRTFDIDGQLLDAREWPHPIGWEYRIRHQWKGDGLRTVALHRVTLKSGLTSVLYDGWRYLLRAPFAGDRGVVLCRPGGRFTFFATDGSEMPATIVRQSPRTLTAGRPHDPLDARLVRALPLRLYERAREALSGVEACRSPLEALPGRCGSLLADVLVDVARGLAHMLMELVETRRVPEVVKGLGVLRELETVAARATLAGRVVGRSVALGLVYDGDLQIGAVDSTRARALHVCLVDFRQTAQRVVPWPRRTSGDGEHLAGHSWQAALAALASNASLRGRIVPSVEKWDWRETWVERAGPDVRVVVSLSLDRDTLTGVVGHVGRESALGGAVRLAEQGLVFDVGPRSGDYDRLAGWMSLSRV